MKKRAWGSLRSRSEARIPPGAIPGSADSLSPTPDLQSKVAQPPTTKKKRGRGDAISPEAIQRAYEVWKAAIEANPRGQKEANLAAAKTVHGTTKRITDIQLATIKRLLRKHRENLKKLSP